MKLVFISIFFMCGFLISSWREPQKHTSGIAHQERLLKLNSSNGPTQVGYVISKFVGLRDDKDARSVVKEYASEG
jgi:hypothetical protein